MVHPLDLPLREMTRRVRDARDPLTAEALVAAALGRIAGRDTQVHAFLHVSAELALSQARAVDAAVREGADPGVLAGIPVAIKDNIAVAGLPLTCASRILGGYIPPVNATVVQRLVATGACIVGKTNLDEFAMGSSTENSAFGPTRNPHDLACVPGGSSGGSAAAVAAGMVPAALGSDTGGSIRQPAALCGIVGMKPSYGRVSRSGLVAFASSLDQVGPLARTVDDAELVLSAIAGTDAQDATTMPRGWLPAPPASLSGLRVGIVREFQLGGRADPSVTRAFEAARSRLRRAGAKEVDVSIPLAGPEGIPIYYIVAPAEASSNLARFDGIRYGAREAGPDLAALYGRTRGRGFGPEVRRRILIGTFVLSAGYADAYYKRAMAARTVLAEQFRHAFASVDVLLSPTTPTPAFRLGEKSADPVQMYLCDVLTVVANLAGVPAVSIPAGLSPEGLPIGLQVWAGEGADERLLAVAAAMEGLLAAEGDAAAPGGAR